MSKTSWNCKHCNNQFTRVHQKNTPEPKYCSVSCKNKGPKGRNIPYEELNFDFMKFPRDPLYEEKLITMSRLNCLSMSLSVTSIILALYLIFGCHVVRAADDQSFVVAIPERVCRSPKLHNLRSAHIYSRAAQAMGTTREVIDEIAMLKSEYHSHIENVASCQNIYQFELSRTILSWEILRIANRNLRFWLEFTQNLDTK